MDAAGGRRIPAGYALCAVTPAAGRESLRLARSAPPFDKGGFVCGVRWGLHGRFAVAGSGHGGQRAGRPTFPFPVGCRAGAPPAEVGGRQNVTGLADRRGGFHIRPWECTWRKWN